MHVALTRRDTPLQLPDGINVFIFTLAGALLKAGHRVSVVSAVASDVDEIAAHFHLPQMPDIYGLSSRERVANSRLPVVWARAGRRLFDRVRPDFVIVNGVVPTRLSRLDIAVCHDMEPRTAPGGLPAIQRIYRTFGYRRTDLVVATSTEIRGDLAVELRRPARDIAVIPTCIDNTSYRAAPLGKRSRGILHMGTPSYKNPAATVRAFARVPLDDAELFITGRPSPEMEEAIAALPPATRTRVHTLGFVTQEKLRELLATVRAVAVPSEYVTPVASPTVLEAFAAATPVVASRSISTDLLTADRNGYVIAPDDPESMGRSLTKLLADDENWRALSEGAAETARAFDAGHVADAYLELFSRSGRP